MRQSSNCLAHKLVAKDKDQARPTQRNRVEKPQVLIEILISPLPNNFSSDNLKELLAQHAQINPFEIGTRIHHSGVGVITTLSNTQTKKIIQQLQRTKIVLDGVVVEVARVKSALDNSVFPILIQNVAQMTSAQVLKNYFNRYGDVQNVVFLPSGPVICYDNQESVDNVCICAETDAFEEEVPWVTEGEKLCVRCLNAAEYCEISTPGDLSFE